MSQNRGRRCLCTDEGSSALVPDTRGGALPTSSSFEEFFRAEYPVLVRIAYGIVRDTHLAEDVAQDVLIAAQQRFPEPDGSDHAQAWVKIATTHAKLERDPQQPPSS